MPDKLRTIEQILTMLAEAPSRLASITVGVAPAQLRASLGQGEWSVVDVLAHMRSCADVWSSYIGRILVEDRPTTEQSILPPGSN